MKKKLHFLFLLALFFSCHNLYSQQSHFLELRPGPGDGIDCEIRTDMDWPIWYEDDLIANAWTVQGSSFLERSLIKFDLSAIPDGAAIVSAKLSLFCNTITGHHQVHSGYNASYLLRITQPWDQYTVTWNTQPSVTYSDAVEIPMTMYQFQDYPDIDVTNHIRYFYNNPDQNYGFMFQLKEEIQYAAIVFSSSDHTDPAKRPLLSIEYVICDKPDASYTFSFTGNKNELQFSANEPTNSYYWWDFGNGFYSDLINPVYSFPDTGSYNVCLKVANDCDTTTYCAIVNVSCPEVNTNFNYEITGNYVQFSPEVIASEHQYLWDFGDGFFSYLIEPLHYYNEIGNYKVCLTISTDCYDDSHCDSINMIIEPEVLAFPEIIRIFPNPSYGDFRVIRSDETVEFKGINIINFNGTIVLNDNSRRISKESNSYACDLTGFESGIYTIQVITNRGIITQKALVSGR